MSAPITEPTPKPALQQSASELWPDETPVQKKPLAHLKIAPGLFDQQVDLVSVNRDLNWD